MKTSYKILIGVIVLIVLAGLYFGFRINGNTIKDNNKTIKVGVILPLTGKNSYLGDYMNPAIEIATDEINSKGGINGKKIELVNEDSQGTAATSVSAYRNLVSRDIHYYITSMSSVTLAIAPIAEENKNILINVGSSSPKITNAGDYVFRHNLMPTDEAKILARHVYDLGYKRIATIYANNEGTIGSRDVFVEEYKRLGGEIITEEVYDFGATDFRSNIEKLKQANPDAVLVSSFANEEGILLKQSRELGYRPQWFGFYFAGDPLAVKIAGNATEGLMFTHFFDPNANSEKIQEFKLKYKEKTNREPEAYAALAYDTVYILAKAIENCQNIEDANCVKNEMYQVRMNGVTGDISFDSNGDTIKSGIYLMKIQNGTFVRYGGVK
jgi:branched-chain amino acid transport system substrate-binding protein